MTREEIREAAQDAWSEYAYRLEPNCLYFTTFEDGFELGVQCAYAHPRWISVEDELPPKNSEYEDLSNNVLATDGKEIYESVYNYDCEAWYTHDMWRLDNITHWMPLPAPPSCSEFPNNQERRVIGTADHIKTALDVMKEGGEE